MPGHIDVHHHALPGFYVDEVGVDAITSQAPRFSRIALDWSPERSIEVMDANGVQAAVLSVSAPGLWFGDQAQTTRLALKSNDFMAEQATRWPGRLGTFAALPLPDVDAALREIERAADELKVDGFGLMSVVGNRYPGDPEFAPVFDALNERGAVVFIHPTVSDACNGLMPGLPSSVLEFPLDTTRAAYSLLYSGVLARCPRIRFVFSHAGGAIPYLAHRMARLEQLDEFAEKTGGKAIELLQRQFYDTALSANPTTLTALQAFVPDTQILFGSDFPFAPNMMPRSLAALEAHPFDATSRQRISRENALKLFPRLSGVTA